MTFLDAIRTSEFWARFGWLALIAGVWLGSSVYVAAVLDHMRRRQAALDQRAAETRALLRRVR